MKSTLTMAEHVAHSVRDFQQQRTGHAPKSVTVVLSEGTLVVTLHEALTPAEKALSRTAEGAAQVREFHRELFQSSVGTLRAEIERITGVVADPYSQIRLASVQVQQFIGRTHLQVHFGVLGAKLLKHRQQMRCT